MKSGQSKGAFPQAMNPNDQTLALSTKKYHNYSLAFYQKDAALN